MTRAGMLSKDLDIKEIAFLASKASESVQEVEIGKKGVRVSCKSVLSIASLGLRAGDEIYVRTDDPQVMSNVIEYLRNL